MIFAMAEKEPTLFVFISKKDFAFSQAGRTLTVMPDQLPGVHFTKVIISCHETQEEALAIIQNAPGAKMRAPAAKTQEGHVKCNRCEGSMIPHTVLDGKCIACWREMALDRPAMDE